MLPEKLENTVETKPKKTFKNILKYFLVSAVSMPVIFFVIVTIGSNMLYFPKFDIHPTTMPHKDVYFKTGDNNILNAWYVKAKKGKPTVVFSHGNGDNITEFFPMLKAATDLGYGVFIYDYRGYGKSEGIPHEDGLYEDLESAIKYLNNQHHIKNKDIILWGLSMGGGVTAEIASKDSFRGVILQSTFSNIRDMVVYSLNTVFLRNETNNFIKNVITKFVYAVPIIQEYDTKTKIKKINVPLLILHSKQDTKIPYEQAKENYANNVNAKLYISEHGGHDEYGWSDLKVRQFLKGLM